MSTLLKRINSLLQLISFLRNLGSTFNSNTLTLKHNFLTCNSNTCIYMHLSLHGTVIINILYSTNLSSHKWDYIHYIKLTLSSWYDRSSFTPSSPSLLVNSDCPFKLSCSNPDMGVSLSRQSVAFFPLLELCSSSFTCS